jgi:hypothetical protein
MSNFRKIVACSLVAASFAGPTLASSPASAWNRCYGWYRGAWGWIGGGALASACSSYTDPAHYPFPIVYPYGYVGRLCVVRNPIYDEHGYFLGYQPMSITC